MNNKSIIQNAPESATHFDGVGAFYRETPSGYDYFCPKYGVISGDPLHDIINIRSLADIRRIVELEEENERLHEAIEILRTAGNQWVYASVIEWNELRDRALKLRDGKQ